MADSSQPDPALLARFEALQRQVLGCRRCADAGYTTIGTPVIGGDAAILAHRRPVMLVGQAPGRAESQSGLPFSGPSGRRLFGWIARIGVSEPAFRRQVSMAAMTRCYPGQSPTGHGDRRPSREELSLCKPYLDAQLAIVQPALVILVGGMAMDALLGKLPLDQAVGQAHRRDGRMYLPLPHPSGASTWLNHPAHQELLDESLRLLAASRLIIPDLPPHATPDE